MELEFFFAKTNSYLVIICLLSMYLPPESKINLETHFWGENLTFGVPINGKIGVENFHAKVPLRKQGAASCFLRTSQLISYLFKCKKVKYFCLDFKFGNF